MLVIAGIGGVGNMGDLIRAETIDEGERIGGHSRKDRAQTLRSLSVIGYAASSI